MTSTRPARDAAAARRTRDPGEDVRAARAAGRRVQQGPSRRPDRPAYRPGERGYRPGRRLAPPPARRSWVATFVRRWGWRAYAVPVLAVVTVVALMTTHSHSAAKGTTAAADAVRPAAPAAAPSQLQLKDDAPGAGADNTVLKGYALPSGPAYTTKGTGTFRVLKGTSPVVGKGRLYRYSIDVENGIDDVDLAQFQALVVSTLSDRRSWAGHGDVRLQRVDSGAVDFHVTLTSSLTVRSICGYTIHAESSCYAPAGTDGLTVNRVVVNDSRWVRGSTAYLGDLASYRIYMINHEDGHALGHEHAHQCLPGGLAPVMMQQTFGLKSATTGQLCQANPWPYPPGAAGTPGAEQPDTNKNQEYDLGD